MVAQFNNSVADYTDPNSPNFDANRIHPVVTVAATKHYSPVRLQERQYLLGLLEFREAFVEGDWRDCNEICTIHGKRPVQYNWAELFPLGSSNTVPAVTFLETAKPIVERLNEKDAMSAAEYEALCDVPLAEVDGVQLAQNLFAIDLQLDISYSMKGYEELYQIVEKSTYEALYGSAAFARRREDFNVVKLSCGTFNHQRQRVTIPTNLEEYKLMKQAPKVNGWTDLYTTLGLMIRRAFLATNIETSSETIEQVMIGGIIFTDGVHCLPEGHPDSPVDFEELKSLYSDARDNSVFIGAITCCPEAFKFFQDLGFKRGENLLFVKKHQDRKLFYKALRKAVQMMSGYTMHSLHSAVSEVSDNGGW